MEGGVVLLLGPPGAGKSLLGAVLARNQAATSFLDVGQLLRGRGLLREAEACPTQALRRKLAAAAREAVAAELAQLCPPGALAPCGAAPEAPADKTGGGAAAAAPPVPHVLVLEYVKELSDGYDLLQLLREFDIPLLQVRLRRRAGAVTADLFCSGACAT
jgi:hypothetical protein